MELTVGQAVATLFGGVGLLLLGMSMMSDGLEQVAGLGLQRILRVLRYHETTSEQALLAAGSPWPPWKPRCAASVRCGAPASKRARRMRMQRPTLMWVKSSRHRWRNDSSRPWSYVCC
jgi:hypothetical protein